MPDVGTVTDDWVMRCTFTILNPLRSPEWRYRPGLELPASRPPASFPSDNLRTRRLLARRRSHSPGSGVSNRSGGDCRDSVVATAVGLPACGGALRRAVEADLLAAAPLSQALARAGYARRLGQATLGRVTGSFFGQRRKTGATTDDSP